PCPCGHGTDSGECECPPHAVARYGAKLSGALADRIDIGISVDRPDSDGLAEGPGEGSDAVRRRLERARRRQAERLGRGRCNADSDAADLRRLVGLDSAASRALASGYDSLGLSGRGWDRVMKVARTIADLGDADRVTEGHINEALTLRRK